MGRRLRGCAAAKAAAVPQEHVTTTCLTGHAQGYTQLPVGLSITGVGNTIGWLQVGQCSSHLQLEPLFVPRASVYSAIMLGVRNSLEKRQPKSVPVRHPFAYGKWIL